MRFSFIFVLSLFSFYAYSVAERVELEYKLAVPTGKEDEVYAMVGDSFAHGDRLGLGADVSSSTGTEIFRDVYYDTSDLRLHEMNSSLRFRRRVNLTNTKDRKNGRMLIQLKLALQGKADIVKGEVKFQARNKAHHSSDESIIQKLKKYELTRFEKTMKEIGFDWRDLRRTLTLTQERRRFYGIRNGRIFMTVTFDRGQADEIFGHYTFSEIEIEINENLYTETPEAERPKLAAMAKTAADAIIARCPGVKPNTLSKYSYAVEHFRKESPIRFWLKRHL